ncbi:topology modulation protein [Halalkalibacter urbisdiaboli]|uniref:topology modulation protein n=1 Tax=Halalkalibacter urbisdiaboli TaxID=1960589 RepID=UPI000B43827F|nr:topology modulation protein [Halalkalibacter urbisdiaboli]
MNRIMVMGVSAGVGKSTFARRLGNALHIEVYHLDTLFWKPEWVQASLEEFSDKQKEIMKKENWIIEGNYQSTVRIRVEQADTIIYLERSLPVCLYRVVKRWLTNIGKTRIDMGEGCKEKLDWPFIKFILTTYYRRKHSADDRLKDLQKLGFPKKIITLKGRREINEFLDKIENKKELK